MTKGVFDARSGSVYDDDIVERYHFPNRYLPIALQFVGDWIVYRETLRGGGRSGYVAAARVVRIEPDPQRRDHSYAYVDRFLAFDNVVPMRRGDEYLEALLEALPDRSKVGVALRGRSIRPLSDEEFATIAVAGLNASLAAENAVKLELDPASADAETLSLVNAPLAEQERRIEQILLNRKIRDASFRWQVCEAYGETCAVTGLRMINGSGRSEVQAAHIWAVKDGGPDVVQNGLALSATVHWLFDRHLISLTDDYGLLVSHNQVPEELRTLFDRQLARIRLPRDRRLWPHPAYVRRHREAYLSA
jgi:putative restriction endonuclease